MSIAKEIFQKLDILMCYDECDYEYRREKNYATIKFFFSEYYQ